MNINQNKDERIEYLNQVNDIHTGMLQLQGRTKDFYKLKYQNKSSENIELMDENIKLLENNIRLRRINDLYHQFYNRSSEFLNRMSNN